jgi:vancomycin permeability regulator SanA
LSEARAPNARARRTRTLACVLGALVAMDLTWALLVYPRAAAAHVVSVSAAPLQDVLVLGAGVYPNGEPSRVLRDRLAVAVALHRSGRARSIVVSGDASARSHDETGTMRRYLLAHAVPSEVILEDPLGLRTYDSMRRAKDVYGLSHVTVVTSDFHLARSVRLARAVGLDAVGCGAATHYRSLATQALFWAREIISRHRALVDER